LWTATNVLGKFTVGECGRLAPSPVVPLKQVPPNSEVLTFRKMTAVTLP
jgi:hypothetical protein